MRAFFYLVSMKCNSPTRQTRVSDNDDNQRLTYCPVGYVPIVNPTYEALIGSPTRQTTVTETLRRVQ